MTSSALYLRVHPTRFREGVGGHTHRKSAVEKSWTWQGGYFKAKGGSPASIVVRVGTQGDSTPSPGKVGD